MTPGKRQRKDERTAKSSATFILKRLKSIGRPERATLSLRFFKCGKGEYGEGDRFLGVTVPEQRIIAKTNRDLSFNEIEKLLGSPYHEVRLTGLFILTYAFEAADTKRQKEIFDFYIAHRSAVNNWDLVDVTAPKIVGEYLCGEEQKNASSRTGFGILEQGGRMVSWIPGPSKGGQASRDDRVKMAGREILYRFAESKNLWERRIAIVSTFTFIRKNDFSDTLVIAEMLLGDTHDLIHKAVGWMLREVGKRDRRVLERFLDTHAAVMPRTMLRYAIERLGHGKRRNYMEQ